MATGPGHGPLGARMIPDGHELARTRAKVEAALFGSASDVAQRVGRFVLMERVGAGATAVVYAAYDPRLDRKVALKLVPLASGSGAERARARWIREGRALARLVHPNVLPVFDAGVCGDEGYLAVEFVDGGTLRQWCTRRKRTTGEILEVFERAGRGLEAAHEAGLVHRDFKPDNVLVRRDGCVRVADFGLVVQPGEPEATGADTARARSGSVTRTGAVVGSPAYMAPELLQGARATPAADQFAYCVALWECLTGHRPFERASAEARLSAIEAGVLPNAPEIPRRARRALKRGLAADPADRYGSMGELLRALGARPWYARPRARLAAAGLLFLVGGALVTRARAPGPVGLCASPEDRLAAVWSPNRRKTLRATLASVPAPYAEQAADRAVAALDAYSARWRGAYSQACGVPPERNVPSNGILALRLACLDARLGALAAAVGQLEAPDPDVVARVEALVDAIPDPAPCAAQELVARAGPAPPPPGWADEIDATRSRLAEAAARRRAGKAAAAIALSASLLGSEAAHAYEPVRAEAGAELGSAQADLGLAAQAEHTLRDAVTAAEASRHDELAADLWITLARLAATQGGRLARAELYAERAAAATRRVGLTPAREVALARARAHVDLLAARYDDAVQNLQRGLEQAEALELAPGTRAAMTLELGDALRLRGDHETAARLLAQARTFTSRAFGAGHPRVAEVLASRARLELARGDLDGALAAAVEARAIWHQAFGDRHPRLGEAQAAIGRVYYQQGDYGRAEAAYDEALAVLEGARGGAHPSLAPVLRELGMVRLRRGDETGAREALERALSVAKDSVGDEHPLVASILEGLGTLEVRRGAVESGLAHTRRALAIRTRVLGPEHLHLGYSYNNLGDMLTRLGQYEASIPALERALALFERHLGPEHPTLAYPLTNLGAALRPMGRASEGRTALERALALRRATQVPGPALATTEFELARTLDVLGLEPARAQTLAKAARARFARQPKVYAEVLTRIDRWLAATR